VKLLLYKLDGFFEAADVFSAAGSPKHELFQKILQQRQPSVRG
jgi:hypothetical protein